MTRSQRGTLPATQLLIPYISMCQCKAAFVLLQASDTLRAFVGTRPWSMVTQLLHLALVALRSYFGRTKPLVRTDNYLIELGMPVCL